MPKKPTAPRLVTLNRQGDTLFISYVARQPRGHGFAAQIHNGTEEQAKAWLATRPDLQLVE